MGTSAGGGAKKTTVGRPKGITVRRQAVTGVTGTAGKMKTVKAGRNKKTK